MKSEYISAIALIERLHRQCLEVVKATLEGERIRDLNPVQAMILHNLGDEDLTVGELTQRGYYLGSNVSYNVKKMVENGYVTHERSPHDRRAAIVKATDKGARIVELLNRDFGRQADELTAGGLKTAEMAGAVAVMKRLEGHWAKPHRG